MEALGLMAIFVWLAIIVAFIGGPFFVLAHVSDELGRSRHFMWWGFGGWFGAVMGLLWLIAVGRKEPMVPPVPQSPSVSAAGPQPTPQQQRATPRTPPQASDIPAGGTRTNAPLKSQQRRREQERERSDS
ncbi:MAG: hypothetical protein F4X80_04105 [Chloroflexi bacterium]|nr:hypothetical protein [Chloroflexota bacterium]MYE31839.1 hypothetical protein [Chloroflexota bacterium]